MIKHIVKTLIRKKVVNPTQMNIALELHNTTGEGLLEILVNHKYVDEQHLVYHICKEFEIPSINPDEYNIFRDIIKLIPKAIAIKLNIIPLTCFKSNLVIAMSDPSNISIIDEARFLTGYNIIPTIASHSAIKNAIKKYYTYDHTSAIEITEEIQDIDLSIASRINDQRTILDEVMSELGKELITKSGKPKNSGSEIQDEEVLLLDDIIPQEDDKFISISLYPLKEKTNVISLKFPKNQNTKTSNGEIG